MIFWFTASMGFKRKVKQRRHRGVRVLKHQPAEVIENKFSPLLGFSGIFL